MASYKKRTNIELNKVYSIGTRLLKIEKIRTRLKAVMYDRLEEGIIVELHSYIGTKVWLEKKFIKEHQLSLNIIINSNPYLNILEELKGEFDGKVLGSPKCVLIGSEATLKSFEKFFRDRNWRKQKKTWGIEKKYSFIKQGKQIIFHSTKRRIEIRNINLTEFVIKQWEKLGDIPVNEDGEIEESFKDFEIGTDREEIWLWFEEHFKVSVALDLMKVN